MQSPLVIDTWMLKLLARWSLCVIASAELLLWGRSCSENCSLLGVRCYYLGELCTWGVKCVCAAAIWSASAWTWSLLTPFSLVALHHGLFHHPALTNRVSLLAVSFKGGRALHSSVRAQTYPFSELPLLFPVAEPAPVFSKAGETQTSCVIITACASLSHVSALHPSGVFLVLVTYLALSQGSVRQIFMS